MILDRSPSSKLKKTTLSLITQDHAVGAHKNLLNSVVSMVSKLISVKNYITESLILSTI